MWHKLQNACRIQTELQTEDLIDVLRPGSSCPTRAHQVSSEDADATPYPIHPVAFSVVSRSRFTHQQLTSHPASKFGLKLIGWQTKLSTKAAIGLTPKSDTYNAHEVNSLITLFSVLCGKYRHSKARNVTNKATPALCETLLPLLRNCVAHETSASRNYRVLGYTPPVHGNECRSEKYTKHSRYLQTVLRI